MEGVVLNGTGKLAHLDGWTAAGKTGSAQKIDPATGRYSAKQLIASFTGFAPINNPAVTILVSLDSPVGSTTEGRWPRQFSSGSPSKYCRTLTCHAMCRLARGSCRPCTRIAKYQTALRSKISRRRISRPARPTSYGVNRTK